MSTRSIIMRFNPSTGLFEAAQKYHDGYANTSILRKWYNTPRKVESLFKKINSNVELRSFGVDVKSCEFSKGAYNRQQSAVFDTLQPENETLLYKLHQFNLFRKWLKFFDYPEYVSLWVPSQGWCDFAIGGGRWATRDDIRDYYRDPRFQEKMREYNETMKELCHYMHNIATGQPLPFWKDERTGMKDFSESPSFVNNLPPEIRFFGHESQEFKETKKKLEKKAPALKNHTLLEIDKDEHAFYLLNSWDGEAGTYSLKLSIALFFGAGSEAYFTLHKIDPTTGTAKELTRTAQKDGFSPFLKFDELNKKI